MIGATTFSVGPQNANGRIDAVALAVEKPDVHGDHVRCRVTASFTASAAVVASKSPGLVDSVKDGETGLLVPHGDVPALANALQRVLADDALRASLETRGLAWSQTFTWDRCADEAYAVLERSLGSNRVAGAWPLPHAV